MTRLIAPLALLATSTAAQAHTTGIPHVDGAPAVAWALALILFAGLVALFAQR